MAAAVFHLLVWSRGQVPQGTVSLTGTQQAIWGGFILAAAIYARRWGEQAIEQFQPMITPAMGTAQLLRDRMTRMPALPSLLATALTVASYLVFAPSIGLANDVDGIISTAAILWAWVISGPAALLILRQMLEVSRLLAKVPKLHLLQLRPLYSLSRLTQRSALAVAILVVLSWLLTSPTYLGPEMRGFALLFAMLQASFIALLFLLPLWGTHRRLVEVKQSQLEQNEQRMVTVLERLRQGVERDDGAAIDRQHKALLAVQLEQQALSKVPTWPWTPGTLRGMLGAILLPVILWLAQYALEELVR